ncbi:MAG: hypothetical protein FWH37_07210 [Candidatus Bathyarchaeota archaeon]|nr:hypothetical protein [Candidatus Termiticorpusculum sp.]
MTNAQNNEVDTRKVNFLPDALYSFARQFGSAFILQLHIILSRFQKLGGITKRNQVGNAI